MDRADLEWADKLARNLRLLRAGGELLLGELGDQQLVPLPLVEPRVGAEREEIEVVDS